MKFTPLIPLFHFSKTENKFSVLKLKAGRCNELDKKFTAYNLLYPRQALSSNSLLLLHTE